MFVLSETNAHEWATKCYHLDGFSKFCFTRQSRRGEGTAVFIKNGRHAECQDHTHTRDNIPKEQEAISMNRDESHRHIKTSRKFSLSSGISQRNGSPSPISSDDFPITFQESQNDPATPEAGPPNSPATPLSCTRDQDTGGIPPLLRRSTQMRQPPTRLGIWKLVFFLKGYFAVRGTRLPPDGGSRVPLTSTIWKSNRKLQIYVEGQWLNVKEMWASCFKSELTVRTNTEAQNKMLKEHYLKCHSGRKSLISLLQMMKTFLSDREKHFSKDNLHFSSGHRVYH